MKKIIISLACCALVAPLAFAKEPQKKRAWHFAFVSERPITITAPSAPTRVEGGAAASYQPANTVVVHQDGAGRYVLDGAGHVFNNKGEGIRGAIRPGTPIRIYFTTDESGMQIIDRVLVD